MATSKVIGGNGRLEAMLAPGWTECDVVKLDIDDAQATALGIALNRTAELAAWDNETLGRSLDSLRDEVALDAVGFDGLWLAVLFGARLLIGGRAASGRTAGSRAAARRGGKSAAFKWRRSSSRMDSIGRITQ